MFFFFVRDPDVAARSQQQRLDPSSGRSRGTTNKKKEMLDNPHVLALLPLGQRELLAVRRASRGCRLAAEYVLADAGIALRLTTASQSTVIEIMQSPRWKGLRGLALRGISRRLLCILGSAQSVALAAPQPALHALTHLDLEFADCAPGFLGAFPALTHLKLTLDFFVSTYADALDAAREALDLGARLVSLEIHGKGVTLQRRYTFLEPMRVAMDAIHATMITSNTLTHLALTGGQVEGVVIDAPLHMAVVHDVEGWPGTLAAARPRVHTALESLVWTTHARRIPALAPFTALKTLDIDVTVYPCPADTVRALGLAVPTGIQTLRVALDYARLDPRDLVVVEWPTHALTHLSKLRHLVVDVSFPPRGCGVMEDYLWGAPAELETARLVCRETRCHQLREELREMLDEGADPDDDDIFGMSLDIAALEWHVPDFLASVNEMADARHGTDIVLGGNWVSFG